MRRSGIVVPCLLAVVAVHAGLLGLYYFPAPKILWGDELTYLDSARRLLAGTSPSATLLWPPLYARFVAGLLAVGGGSLIAVQLAQLGLLAVAALVMRDLTRRLLGEGPVARWIACAMLLFPTLAAFADYLWPEVLHLALLTFALWILHARRQHPAWLALLGIDLGLALSTKSLLTPLLPVLILLPGTRLPWRRALPRVALVAAGLLVAVAPTVLSNARHHGRWVIADSALFNVWVGLSDVSRRNFVDEVVGREFNAYVASASDSASRNRVLADKIGARIGDRGPAGVLRDQLGRQYFRLFDKDSFLTDQLVDGAIHRRGAGYRSDSAVVATGLRGVSYTIYGIVLVAAPFGLALCPPAVRRRLWLLLLFLAYNLVLFLVVHVKSRYRIQFAPVLLLLAGCVVQYLPRRSGRSPEGAVRPSIGSLVAAAVCSASLLGLAFAGPLLD